MSNVPVYLHYIMIFGHAQYQVLERKLKELRTKRVRTGIYHQIIGLTG